MIHGSVGTPDVTVVAAGFAAGTPTQLRCLAEYAMHGDRGDAARCLGMRPYTFKNRLYLLYERLGVTRFSEALLAVGWLQIPDEVLA